MNIPIFLYSKYCKQCPELINMIDPNQFLFLCVDNVEVRKKFLNDQRFLVRTVPCIIVYNDISMTFQKYEGSALVEWLDENNYLLDDNNDEEEEQQQEEHQIVDEEAPPASKTIMMLPQPIQPLENENIPTATPDTIPSSQEIDPSGMTDTVSSSDNSSKKSDVMNLAQQMQRERDAEPPLKT